MKKNNLTAHTTKPTFEKFLNNRFFKMFPEIAPALLAFANITENFDTKSPQTEMFEFNKKLAEIEQMPERKRKILSRLVLWTSKKMLANQPEATIVDDLCKHTKQQAQKDARYSLLLELMRKADEKIPSVSLVVVMNFLKPQENLMVNATLSQSLKVAENATGEFRAKLIKQALLEISQYAYYPYVLAVSQLSYFAEGKMPPTEIPSFGELVKQTANRLKDYPGLVEERAGWLRNCAAHHLPTYLPDEDAVIVGAKGVPPIKMKVDELLEITQKMFLISTYTFSQVSYLYVLRNFMKADFLKLLWQSMGDTLSGNPDKVARVEQNFEKYWQSKFQKLIDFANQNSQATP